MKWMALVLPLGVIACSQEKGPATPGSAGSAAVVAVAPAPPPASPPARAADAAVVQPDAPAVQPTREETEHEQALAMASMLASDAPGGIEGDMSVRARPGVDLGQQIADLKKTAPSGRITLRSKKAADPTSLTVDQVAMKIQSAYMAGIKRCYKAKLAADPNARGDVKLSLAIGPTGRTDANVTSFDKTLGDCVEQLARNWRFPVPKDTSGEATTGSFELVLLLVPD